MRWSRAGLLFRSSACWKNISGSIVDYDFTAQMEDYLDEISRDEKGFLDYLQRFYLAVAMA
jgi:DNA topoisomerase IA